MKYIIALVLALASSAAWAGQFCTTSCDPPGNGGSQYCRTNCTDN